MARKQTFNTSTVTFLKDKKKPEDDIYIGDFNLLREMSSLKKKPINKSIKYKCQKCGTCCRKGFSIELSLEEMDYLTDKHPDIKTVFAYTKGDYVHPFFNTGTKCNKLKDGLCTIYKNRPFECRYYPFHLEEVNSPGTGVYEFGKKYFKLFAFEDCKGLGKGEPWSPRKMNSFIKRILQEYVKHKNLLNITYKVLTNDEFFKERKQYGTGVLYGTKKELDEFIEDYYTKFENEE